MKINWFKFNLGVYLKTLEDGAYFLYDQGLYIKTNIEEQQPDPDFIKIMVVDLEDGTVDYLFSDTLVIPIDAEISANDN